MMYVKEWNICMDKEETKDNHYKCEEPNKRTIKYIEWVLIKETSIKTKSRN
tara:strand:+ start:243 stop:395 length:153 start_codon:yes stop_codon:yes gene_type:complete